MTRTLRAFSSIFYYCADFADCFANIFLFCGLCGKCRQYFSNLRTVFDYTDFAECFVNISLFHRLCGPCRQYFSNLRTVCYCADFADFLASIFSFCGLCGPKLINLKLLLNRERTWTRTEHEHVIFAKIPNTNEHEHVFFLKCRTRTNTNTFFPWNIEHERTRTLIFLKTSNTNEHKHVFR